MNFRTKLLLSMMMVVLIITTSTIFITQSKIRSTYDEIIQELFQVQIHVFREKQEQRLENLKNDCLKIAQAVRLLAALEEGEKEMIYQTAGDELRSVRDTYAFYRLLDEEGKVIPQADARSGFTEKSISGKLDREISQVGQGLRDIEESQQVGYLALENEEGRPILHEIILTKIAGIEESQVFGALILGFPLSDLGSFEGHVDSRIISGIFLKDKIYTDSLSVDLKAGLSRQLALQVEKSARPPENYTISVQNKMFRADYTLLNPASKFPPAYQISLYSLESMLLHQQGLVELIVLIGVIAILGALILSLFLAHGLTVPLSELATGTRAIRGGNFEVRVPVRTRDEIGELARSFNDMAEGLALNEKYRNMLNMVADKEVADQLMKGAIELGGETRELSVLFCDIRGFTALTQNMEPSEVVRMLNEHMTALTEVVHEHKGVVDKFVGDLIMAVFGAPKSYDNDAQHAVHCAWQMMRQRESLNEISQYKLQMGIGIASGPALAGCMGSVNRLNYTVLGERVNLASRLCGKAAAGEIVIDQTTRDQLADAGQFEFLERLSLKGFSMPVPAYKVTQIYSAI